MSPETVFKFSRAYRFYYQGKYDLLKYKGRPMKSPPLINQPDRKYYYRISQKLADSQIHALFLSSYFFKPTAYIADIAQPEAFSEAMALAGRAENGRPLFEQDMYRLRKMLQDVVLDEWLYGEWEGSIRSAVPPCLQMVIRKELPIDLAAILFLIPRPEWQYNWAEVVGKDTTGLGAGPWVDRLKKADHLLRLQRPGWRAFAWELSQEFWNGIGEFLNPWIPIQPKTLDI